MPIAKISSDLDLFYRLDDLAEPWRPHETILLLHGNAESSAVWFAWMPHLARTFRVVRPDLRGFGDSTPMPRDYRWSLDAIIDDLICLMDELAIERFHLVGAKVGGKIALRFAARHPQRVSTLTVLGAPEPGTGTPRADTRHDAWIEHIERHGVESWARWTMPGRLGSDFPAAGFEWWIKLMGRTAITTQLGFIATISAMTVLADLPKIECPTLVITTEGHSIVSVDATRAWTGEIPRSELMVLPGDSYHVAATGADRCAQATLDFIRRSEGQGLAEKAARKERKHG